MSRSFSRLSLCAAALGALAIAAFAVAPSRASEEAVIIPVPSADVKEEQVVTVVRNGYSLNGRLLRPAAVVVSSGPEKKA